MKILLSSLLDSVNANYHAYINCPSVSSIPSIECGSLPQQRYRLHSQGQIYQVAVSAVDSIKPITFDERFTSSDESPAEVLTDNKVFEVLSVGSNPFLCFYQISRESGESTTPSVAFSVAKSLYGAVRSLAGYLYQRSFIHRWSWNQAERESAVHVPQARKVYRSQKIVDSPRKAVAIWTRGKYGVIADQLSRVLLIDIEQGLVLKVWKG